MNEIQDSEKTAQAEIESLPAFELMMGMLQQYQARLTYEYGWLSKAGKQALFFTDKGAMRAASIFGYIAALYETGKYEAALAFLKDYTKQLDYLAGYGGPVEVTIQGDSTVYKFPRYRIELSDDGCRHSHTVMWYVYVGFVKPDDYKPDDKKYVVESWGWHKLYYRRTMNGALIYHGPRNNAMNVTLDSHLWSVHT